MAATRYQRAMTQALRDELTQDDSVIIIGEDVRHALRGVTTGFIDEFGPDRILDTPISEQAFTSFAIGASLAGMRPVVEYQIPSLTFLAIEQVVNQAHRMRLMSGGQVSVPVTFFVPGAGARGGLAGQHSDNPYAMFAHYGVKTLVPGTVSDAYHLLRSAIQDPDPVVVVAPAAALGFRGEIEPAAPQIGKAAVLRSGDDLTLVAIGHLVGDALAIADEFDGILSIEVVDLRSAFPLDRRTIVDSVRKTRRLLVLDDGNRSLGLAAEVIASVAEVPLDGPAQRVTRPDATIPFAPPLEQEMLPNRERIRQAVQTMSGGTRD